MDHIIAWRSGRGDRWEDFLAAASPDEPPADLVPRPNLLYTSGTMSVPKGAPLPPNSAAPRNERGAEGAGRRARARAVGRGADGVCRDRLTHYKCPRSVEFVPALPRSVMGKLNMRELRAPYWLAEADG